MTDFYCSADSYNDMAGFLTETNGCFHVRFQNVIGPMRGRAAVRETEESPEVPAAGDPDKWYVCIRVPEDELDLPDGIAAVSEEVGIAVCGIFA